jgi:hypothetical protein
MSPIIVFATVRRAGHASGFRGVWSQLPLLSASCSDADSWEQIDGPDKIPSNPRRQGQPGFVASPLRGGWGDHMKTRREICSREAFPKPKWSVPLAVCLGADVESITDDFDAEARAVRSRVAQSLRSPEAHLAFSRFRKKLFCYVFCYFFVLEVKRHASARVWCWFKQKSKLFGCVFVCCKCNCDGHWSVQRNVYIL